MSGPRVSLNVEVIGTEVALRLPTTYDNNPIPSHPPHPQSLFNHLRGLGLIEVDLQWPPMTTNDYQWLPILQYCNDYQWLHSDKILTKFWRHSDDFSASYKASHFCWQTILHFLEHLRPTRWKIKWHVYDHYRKQGTVQRDWKQN